jgi:hypothetical protein
MSLWQAFPAGPGVPVRHATCTAAGRPPVLHLHSIHESAAPPPARTRRRVGIAVLIAAVVAAAAIGGAAWWLDVVDTRLRAELEEWLSDRLASDVTVGPIHVRFGPEIHVTGDSLTLRIRNRPDLPPFVAIGRWSGTARLSRVGIRHFDEIRLADVRITVPPRRLDDLRPPPPPDAPRRRRRPPALQIDRLVAEHVVLEVTPRDATREPHVWDIRDLRMDPFSFDLASPFQATVDTPLPDDRARVKGTAGPWPHGDFDQLPLAGEYALDGRLDRVPGLQGAIHVRGTALGTLDRLATVGTAESPDAGLVTAAGQALPLSADFEALFDATNSDVHVTRMTLAAGRAQLEATGHVVRARGDRGRRITLHLTAPDTDIADLLRLTIDGRRPPASGRAQLDIALDLPPGDAPVLSRAHVRGRFDVRDARFINPKVQGALDEVSRRGRGQPDDDATGVAARLRGRMALAGGRLAFSAVALHVPGAAIAGAGSYSLPDETLDFHGVASLEARLSRTQRGLKRFLLRPFDRLLARDGAGTRVVMDVRGTRSAPEVDVDLGASLRGR